MTSSSGARCKQELCPLWNGDGRYCAGEQCDDLTDVIGFLGDLADGWE